MEGRDTIVKAMPGIERYERTNHVVSNQLVEIYGDRATGETYCMAHHIHRENGELRNLTMAIRYQDRFRRENGRWYFEERRLGVDWERVEPLGEKGWVAER